MHKKKVNELDKALQHVIDEDAMLERLRGVTDIDDSSMYYILGLSATGLLVKSIKEENK